jgi:2'-5' RNA ligase
MARIFVALTPTKTFNKQIIEIKKDLKKGILKNQNISWQENSNHHITLNFIGEMEPEQLDQLNVGIENFITSRSPIALEIVEISLFPNSSGQVLVAYINLTAQLKRIHDRLGDLISSIGFETHLKKFRPHITLGRFKEKTSEDFSFHEVTENIRSISLTIDTYESEFESGKVNFKLIKSFKN